MNKYVSKQKVMIGGRQRNLYLGTRCGRYYIKGGKKVYVSSGGGQLCPDTFFGPASNSETVPIKPVGTDAGLRRSESRIGFTNPNTGRVQRHIVEHQVVNSAGRQYTKGKPRIKKVWCKNGESSEWPDCCPDKDMYFERMDGTKIPVGKTSDEIMKTAYDCDKLGLSDQHCYNRIMKLHGHVIRSGEHLLPSECYTQNSSRPNSRR